MKRALSLILAVVMVALMIPFATIASVASAEAPYYQCTDFTKTTPDDGTDGTINDSLPTGWIANNDADKYVGLNQWTTTINYDWKDNPHSQKDGVYEDEIKYVGVRLGGANQGIGMTDETNVPKRILNGTADYKITVKWNTTHKFAHIRFGWSGLDQNGTAIVPTQTTIESSNRVFFNATGGPTNKNAFSDGVKDNGAINGGNFVYGTKYVTDIRDSEGNAMDYDAISAAHSEGLVAGEQFTTSFEIKEGKVAAIYNEVDGVVITYLPSAEVKATGYFSIWITNWAANNTVNIQSVAIEEASIEETVAATKLTKGEASYRKDPEGIRFATKFDAEDMQTLVDFYDAGLIKKVEIGTLITTKEWATAAGAVTFEALDAVKGEKTAYVEVMATVGDWYAENTFAGTISSAKAEREYHVVGFVKVTLADDTVVTVYSEANTATLADIMSAPQT